MKFAVGVELKYHTEVTVINITDIEDHQAPTRLLW
jgi:hypothetical protein